MSFRVLMMPEAESDIYGILDHAPDPSIPQAAFREIAHLLETQPLSVGESREQPWQRVIFVEKLMAIYLVDVANSTVFISSVHDLS